MPAIKAMPRKRSNPERDRIELRADPAWIERVMATAEELGLSVSAYIRLAVNEKMKRDSPDQSAPQRN